MFSVMRIVVELVADAVVFIVIENGTRRLVHVNVTGHPTVDWTLQQLREVIGDDDVHKYLIHDQDHIFAKYLDDSIRAWV